MSREPDRPASAVSSVDQLESIWHGQMVYWHAGFALGWLACLVLVVFGGQPQSGRTPSLLALLVLALAYLAIGSRSLADYRLAHGIAYHVVAWSALTILLWFDSGKAWVFFFILFPQLWAMLPVRVATAWTIAFGVVLVVFGLARDVDTSPASVMMSAALTVGFSLGMGLFVNKMVDEAQQRALVIDELHAAQKELAAAERDRGVLEERQRLSREIHDTLAQGYTSVLALARAADAALARGDDRTAHDRLALIESVAAENLGEARMIVAELTPGHLQSRSLVEALRRLVDTVGGPASERGLRVGFDAEGKSVALGGATEVVLLRTAQEALANVRRHSGATAAQVTLSFADPRKVALSVADNGAGFDPAAAPRGFGLDGLHARVSELGGIVRIDSAPGRGAVVTVEVPR